MKTCSRCKMEKPVEDFYADKARKDGRYPQCKLCARAAKKKVRDTDEYRAYMQAYRKIWSKNNPELLARQNRRSGLKKYGLTLEGYEEILARQGGVCLICGENENGRTLAVDHCHETGKIRGLLCSLCNRGIGMFRDRPDLLIKASEYLCS